METRVYKLFRYTKVQILTLDKCFNVKTTSQIHVFFLQIHKEMFFEEFMFVKVLIELQMRHVTQNTRIS